MGKAGCPRLNIFIFYPQIPDEVNMSAAVAAFVSALFSAALCVEITGLLVI